MNPAKRVIEKFGGVAAMSHLTGIPQTYLYKWTYPKERGGTGGLIPSNRQSEILICARENAISVEPEDFFDLPEATS